MAFKHYDSSGSHMVVGGNGTQKFEASSFFGRVAVAANLAGRGNFLCATNEKYFLKVSWKASAKPAFPTISRCRWKSFVVPYRVFRRADTLLEPNAGTMAAYFSENREASIGCSRSSLGRERRRYSRIIFPAENVYLGEKERDIFIGREEQ